MQQLIEDYTHRLKAVSYMLQDREHMDDVEIKRLETKMGCYRLFLIELHREQTNTLEEFIDWARECGEEAFYIFESPEEAIERFLEQRSKI